MMCAAPTCTCLSCDRPVHAEPWTSCITRLHMPNRILRSAGLGTAHPALLALRSNALASSGITLVVSFAAGPRACSSRADAAASERVVLRPQPEPETRTAPLRSTRGLRLLSWRTLSLRTEIDLRASAPRDVRVRASDLEGPAT
eukprot:2500450-Rhodomonas_salina.1